MPSSCGGPEARIGTAGSYGVGAGNQTESSEEQPVLSTMEPFLQLLLFHFIFKKVVKILLWHELCSFKN